MLGLSTNIIRSKWTLRNMSMTATTVFLPSLSPSVPPRVLLRAGVSREIHGGCVLAVRTTQRNLISFGESDFSHSSREVVTFGVNSDSSSRANDGIEPLFLDDNGAVDDMEGYLNHLSLEYDSVWDTKPSWCQPWTITLTGMLTIASSWFILHSAVITTVVLLLICTWWYIFLYSYPKAYSEMIEERRKRVANGAEDTYGQRKQV